MQARQRNQLMIAAALLALAALLLSFSLRGRGEPTWAAAPAYYYDLTDGTLFVDTTDRLPPIPSPAGHQSAKAYVFSCGACTSEAWFPAYLETYTDEGKRQLEGKSRQEAAAMGPLYMQLMRDEVRLRSVDGDGWLDERARDALIQAAESRCHPLPAMSCEPQ